MCYISDIVNDKSHSLLIITSRLCGHRKFAQKSYKHANWLKIGVTWSDAVLTVSPGYALELVRGGLEASGVWNALQKIGVKGIRNGIDINVWDPQKDRHLPQNLRYSINDVERGKHRAKIALQVHTEYGYCNPNKSNWEQCTASE